MKGFRAFCKPPGLTVGFCRKYIEGARQDLEGQWFAPGEPRIGQPVSPWPLQAGQEIHG